MGFGPTKLITRSILGRLFYKSIVPLVYVFIPISALLGNNGNPAFVSKLKNSTKPILIQAFSENHNLDPKEVDFILEYVLSAMIGIMSYWFRQSKVLTADELIALMSDLMENGVMKRLIP